MWTAITLSSHFRSLGGATMYRRVSQAILLNKLHRVRVYGSLSREYPVDLLFFDPGGIDWARERVGGLLLKRGRWQQGYFAFPKIIYNRCFPEPQDLLLRLGQILGSEHIFNDRTHFDKWDVYQSLEEQGLGEYLPRTYKYTDDDFGEILTRHPSLILKPRLSHGGAGVLKLTLLTPNVIIIRSGVGIPVPLIGADLFIPLLLATAPPETFIAQEYIESAVLGDDRFDVRILMQKNGGGNWEVGGELSRIGLASNLLTNHYHTIAAPADFVPSPLLARLRAISQAVAESLDGSYAILGELGVDFLIDVEGNPWILEVNGKPDKSLFWGLADKALLRRIYLNPLAYQGHLLSTLQARQVP